MMFLDSTQQEHKKLGANNKSKITRRKRHIVDQAVDLDLATLAAARIALTVDKDRPVQMKRFCRTVAATR